jgi:hypothetical protein
VTKRRGELVANPLADDRFAAMFEEDEYAVDEESAEYRLIHPNVGRDNNRNKSNQLINEHFEQVCPYHGLWGRELYPISCKPPSLKS